MAFLSHHQVVVLCVIPGTNVTVYHGSLQSSILFVVVVVVVVVVVQRNGPSCLIRLGESDDECHSTDFPRRIRQDGSSCCTAPEQVE